MGCNDEKEATFLILKNISNLYKSNDALIISSLNFNIVPLKTSKTVHRKYNI
jgi:hypothetical protein